MFDGRWRSTFEKGLRPVGGQLRRTGITANHLTTTGLVMAVAAAVAIANGWLRAGLLLLVLTAVPDSVIDRVSDALLLGGVAWYLDSTQPGRVSVLPLAVLAASMLISYERAKAESLGFDARGGLMERAERLVLLAFGLLFESLLVPVLWVMLALTLVTAVQRFVKVWRQASAPQVQPLSARWRSRRVARSTQRTWRRQALAHRRRR
jgi:CDP-diacylglycerol--glycerol-3-phosphate 3-phosphatidyltransferase